MLAAHALLMAAAGVADDPQSRTAGASVPWTRHEAEDAASTVDPSPASRDYLTPASEAAGRRFVRLEKPGDKVEFTAACAANGLVVRYSITDSTDGAGRDGTLTLLINGRIVDTLPLTSRLSWVYGDFPWSNDPAHGRGHCFFDECRRLIPDVVAGDIVALQVGADDVAGGCLVDFIELEAVPPPLPRPDGSLSIVDFGATANDTTDDSQAFLKCVDAARHDHRIAWIPAGDFVLDGSFKKLGGVEIRGAGMWHSCLRGVAPIFQGTGEPLKVSDLAIIGAVDHRDDGSPDNAFNGNLGDGSEIARIWIEHLKCGVWATRGTRNLRVHGCRIRNTLADGINLCDGTTDSVVEECHLRNTGDDALSTWSPSGEWSSKQPCERNRFVHNTVEAPWHANGIGVYGGHDHAVRHNLVSDTVFSGGGLLISSGHGALPFRGTIEAVGNRFVRTGGECYLGERTGSLWIHAHHSDIEARLVIRDLAIVDPAGDAVTIHGPCRVRDLAVADASFLCVTGQAIRLMPSAPPVDVTIDGMRIEPAKSPTRSD